MLRVNYEPWLDHIPMISTPKSHLDLPEAWGWFYPGDAPIGQSLHAELQRELPPGICFSDAQLRRWLFAKIRTTFCFVTLTSLIDLQSFT